MTDEAHTSLDEQPHKHHELFARHPDAEPEASTSSNTRPALIIVMGVSGCGKSTVGEDLASRFNIQFVDGDSLHPKSNVEKMSHGIPLNDDDRLPWLNDIRKEAAKLTTPASLASYYSSRSLKDPSQPRSAIVIACSSLKRSYRDLLRGSTHGEDPQVDKSHEGVETYFVYLKGSRELLLGRMKARKNHFFAADMLDSQLSTLEEPSESEENTDGVAEVSIDQSEQAVVDEAVKAVTRLVGLVPLQK